MGALDGDLVGCQDGLDVVGAREGDLVGKCVGFLVGPAEGALEGARDGDRDGRCVGLAVVGLSVVGDRVGLEVGAAEG